VFSQVGDPGPGPVGVGTFYHGTESPETRHDIVGDSADGFPGLPGWGAKSTSLVLARYGHLEDIPDAVGKWDVSGLRGAAKLSATLQAQIEDAVLFRLIATVETDIDVGAVDDWRWTGPTSEFTAVAEHLGSPDLPAYANRLAP
jgi:5'-3' exonuclease